MINQLKAGAALSYLSLFISSFISIVYTPIMLKLLGQSDYGIYSLATSATGYIGALMFLLGSAVIRYTSKYKSLAEDEKCSNLYGMFCIMYGVLGVLALVLGIVLTLNVNNMFSNSLSVEEIHKLRIVIGIMVVGISFGIGFGFFSAIGLAHEKFIFQKVLGIVSSIINPLIMVPLFMMGHGVITMAIVTTLLNFITVLINIYYCFRVLKIKIIFNKFDLNLLKEITVFSSFIFLNLIVERIYWSTDQIILGIYSGAISISIYTIGASFSGYFSGLSAAISNVFLSKVTGMVTKEVSDKEISDLFIRVGRIQYIIISFALSGFLVLGQEFINLWVGEEYNSSFIIAVMLTIPMTVPLIQGIGGVIIQAKNIQKFRTIVYFAIAIANILLSLLFVQWWGAIGCALATALAFTIGNIIIMNIYYWKKINIDIPKFWLNILFMSAPFVVSLLTGLTINKLVIAESWIVFVFKTIAFSIFYSLLMWFMGMNRYEKDLIIPTFRSIMRKIRTKKLYKIS
ncbi:oligosaccharide flippase family protein [Priestia megaterium]|nr:oligosaccharide flippase family protein [Priestia megaterium]